jgi:hypothetical protein
MKRNGLAALAAVLLAGCATNRPATVGAPTTTAAREQIHQASSSARSAADAVRATGESNRKISGALDAIDHKAAIIDRWLETHRPKP